MTTDGQKLSRPQLILAFAAIFALFFISRGQNILWGEIFTLRGNEFDSYRDTATSFSLITWKHLFPLYYRVTQLLVHLFGYSDTVIRLFPLAATLVSVPVFSQMLRKRHDDATAIAFGLLLLFSPIHLLYSANARAYAICFFLVGVFFLILSDYFVHGRLSGRQVAILAMAGAGAALSHNSAIIPLGAALCFFAGHAVVNRKLPAKAMAALAIAFAAMAAIAWAILSRHLAEAALNPMRAAKVLVGVVNEIEFPLFALVAIHGVYLAVSRRRMDIIFFLATIAISFAGVFAIGALDPKIANRYLYTSLSPFFFIGAISTAEISKAFAGRREYWLVTILVPVMIGSANLLELADFYRDGDRYDYRAAVRFVDERARPGDLMLAPPLPGVPGRPRTELYPAAIKAKTLAEAPGRIADATFTAIPDYIDTENLCLRQGDLWFIVREEQELCLPGDDTLFCRITERVKGIGVTRFDHHRWFLGIYRTKLPACRE